MNLNNPMLGIAVLLFGAVLTIAIVNLDVILKNLKSRS